jgi:septal ring factor EnvC (AmiA/AmiB activator)
MKKLIFLTGFFFSTVTFANIPDPAHTEDPTKVKTSLAKVQKKIQKLEKTIYHTAHQEKTLTQHLAALEKEMGERSEQLRQLEQKQHAHHLALQNLQKEAQKLAVFHNAHQAALAQLIQTTFQHHHHEKFQLLLSPNEWSTLSRLEHYYQFFYAARADHITELQNNLNRVQLLQQNIVQEQQHIHTIAQNVKDIKQQLESKKQERTAVLASLSQNIAGAQEKLSQLQQQEQHLSQLFKMLQEKLATTPTYIEPVQDFAKMKSQLALPIQTFGAKLAALSNLKRSDEKKTYIDAPAGTPVNAIFSGRVVFAEWLRGVGLLMIVDHGNGYMSLYGNNQKLYKGLGDWVNNGEMIARVGQSGGHAEPGLYFEIRKDGEALDPTPWFVQG